MNDQHDKAVTEAVKDTEMGYPKCGINGVFSLQGKFAACADHSGGENFCYHQGACGHKVKD